MSHEPDTEPEDTAPRAAGSRNLVLWVLYLGILAWAAYGWFGR